MLTEDQLNGRLPQSLGQNTESRISEISSSTADGFLLADFLFVCLFVLSNFFFTSQEAVIQSPDGGFDNRVLVVGLPPAH